MQCIIDRLQSVILKYANLTMFTTLKCKRNFFKMHLCIYIIKLKITNDVCMYMLICTK